MRESLPAAGLSMVRLCGGVASAPGSGLGEAPKPSLVLAAMQWLC